MINSITHERSYRLGTTANSNIVEDLPNIVSSDVMKRIGFLCRGHLNFEPRHEKTCVLHMHKQRRRSAARLTAQQISTFVFAKEIVQPPFFLNMKFQASSHRLWLYSPVCVRPGQKPRRKVFSLRGPIMSFPQGLLSKY